MGVIQQSFNQAASVAGLAKHLYQQSPGYQKKMEEEDFKKSLDEYEEVQKTLDLKRQKAEPLVQKELENAQIQMGERHAADLLARGKYVAYANQVENNARVRQLRGLLPLSQELVAKQKEGIKCVKVIKPRTTPVFRTYQPL